MTVTFPVYLNPKEGPEGAVNVEKLMPVRDGCPKLKYVCIHTPPSSPLQVRLRIILRSPSTIPRSTERMGMRLQTLAGLDGWEASQVKLDILSMCAMSLLLFL